MSSSDRPEADVIRKLATRLRMESRDVTANLDGAAHIARDMRAAADTLAAVVTALDQAEARAERAEKAVRGDSVRRHLRFLFESFSEVPPAVKVLKIAEELGEATEALIGSLRLNPRKLDRPTHTRADVAKELADVVITAMVALHEFSEEPVQTVTNRLREVAERAGSLAAVEEVSEPSVAIGSQTVDDAGAVATRKDATPGGSLTVLERLERLEHDAPPGPWYAGGGYPQRITAIGPATLIADCFEDPDSIPVTADLIVAMRNALPSLLAIAKQAAVIQAAIEGNSHARLEWDIGLLRAQLARLQETQL